MNFTEIVVWIARLLQLSVACYALRLNRLFGASRIGWSLFSAFVLLALVHLYQSMGPENAGGGLRIEFDVVYAFISLLLLIGMAHIETLFKERSRLEQEELKIQHELELRVKEKTADFSAANQKLQMEVVKHMLTATRLEEEVAERERLAAQMEKTYKELVAASRQAGMTEIATNVLHNVGNVLNSVNVSANLVSEHLMQSKVGNISRVAALMRDHTEDLGDFMTKDPKGRQLPAYLDELANHLAEEQTLLSHEIGFVRKKIEHIKDIVMTQQNYARVAGVTEPIKLADLVEDALHLNADALTRGDMQIVREYAPQIPEIIGEKHKILQILVNLLRNARHACDESGRPDKQLTISVTNGGNRVCIVVADNGVGITTTNLTKIFNYGFTTRKGGHGFGLHGSSLAAKDMGGTLSAQSEGPGKGATFTLELPLQPRPSRN